MFEQTGFEALRWSTKTTVASRDLIRMASALDLLSDAAAAFIDAAEGGSVDSLRATTSGEKHRMEDVMQANQDFRRRVEEMYSEEEEEEERDLEAEHIASLLSLVLPSKRGRSRAGTANSTSSSYLPPLQHQYQQSQTNGQSSMRNPEVPVDDGENTESDSDLPTLPHANTRQQLPTVLPPLPSLPPIHQLPPLQTFLPSTSSSRHTSHVLNPFSSLPPLPSPPPAPIPQPAQIQPQAPPFPPPHAIPIDAGTISCPCPNPTIDDGFTIQCEICNIWLHASCMGIREEDENTNGGKLVMLDGREVPEVFWCGRCLEWEKDVREKKGRGGRGRRSNTDATAGGTVNGNFGGDEKAAPKMETTSNAPSVPASTPTTTATTAIDDPTPRDAIGRRRRVPKPVGRPRAATSNATPDHSLYSTPSADHVRPTFPSGSLTNNSHIAMSMRGSQALHANGHGIGSGNGINHLGVMSDDEEGGENYETWMYEFTPVEKNLYRDKKLLDRLSRLLLGGEEESDSGTVEADSESKWFGKRSRTTTLAKEPLAHYLNDTTPLLLSALPSPSPTSVQPLPATSLLLTPPVSFTYSTTSSAAHSHTHALLCPYPRSTSHALFADALIPANTFILPVFGQVTSREEYKENPINQYENLGVPKAGVRSLGMPWNLMIDGRNLGNESRFVRSGCHPNAVVRIIRLNVDSEEAEEKKAEKEKEHWNDQSGAGVGTQLVFAIFSTVEIGKKAEIILPWDWDDQHLVHSLPIFMNTLATPSSNSSGSTLPSNLLPSDLDSLSRKMSLVTNTILSTTSCACEKKKDCALFWMCRGAGVLVNPTCSNRAASGKREPFSTLFLNALEGGKEEAGVAQKAKGRKPKKPDVGPLVGFVRDWEEVKKVVVLPPPPTIIEVVEVKEVQGEEVAMQVEEAKVVPPPIPIPKITTGKKRGPKPKLKLIPAETSNDSESSSSTTAIIVPVPKQQPPKLKPSKRTVTTTPPVALPNPIPTPTASVPIVEDGNNSDDSDLTEPLPDQSDDEFSLIRPKKEEVDEVSGSGSEEEVVVRPPPRRKLVKGSDRKASLKRSSSSKDIGPARKKQREDSGGLGLSAGKKKKSSLVTMESSKGESKKLDSESSGFGRKEDKRIGDGSKIKSAARDGSELSKVKRRESGEFEKVTRSATPPGDSHLIRKASVTAAVPLVPVARLDIMEDVVMDERKLSMNLLTLGYADRVFCVVARVDAVIPLSPPVVVIEPAREATPPPPIPEPEPEPPKPVVPRARLSLAAYRQRQALKPIEPTPELSPSSEPPVVHEQPEAGEIIESPPRMELKELPTVPRFDMTPVQHSIALHAPSSASLEESGSGTPPRPIVSVSTEELLKGIGDYFARESVPKTTPQNYHRPLGAPPSFPTQEVPQLAPSVDIRSPTRQNYSELATSSGLQLDPASTRTYGRRPSVYSGSGTSYVSSNASKYAPSAATSTFTSQSAHTPFAISPPTGPRRRASASPAFSVSPFAPPLPLPTARLSPIIRASEALHGVPTGPSGPRHPNQPRPAFPPRAASDAQYVVRNPPSHQSAGGSYRPPPPPPPLAVVNDSPPTTTSYLPSGPRAFGNGAGGSGTGPPPRTNWPAQQGLGGGQGQGQGMGMGPGRGGGGRGRFMGKSSLS